MAPVIARGVLRFGLVSIPIDIHSAIEDQSIRMHLLHKKCGSTHFMYFANEVHDFDQIPKARGKKVPKHEIDLGRDLIDKMSAEKFQPENYRERFLAMVDPKTKDKEITVAPPTPGRGGKVVDLMAVLKQSPEQSAPQPEPATQIVRTETKTARKRRKA